MVKPVEILAESPYTVVYGALVMTPAMLLRLINCRFIIIIILPSVDIFPREFKN